MRSVVVALVVLSAAGCGSDEAVPDAPGPPPDAAPTDDAALPDDAEPPPDAEPTDLVIGEPFESPDDVDGPALDGIHGTLAWNGTDFVLVDGGMEYSKLLVRRIGPDGAFRGARHATADMDYAAGGLVCRTDGSCAHSASNGIGLPQHKLVMVPAVDDGSNAQGSFVELSNGLSNAPPFVGAHDGGYVAVGGIVGTERYQRVTAGGLLIDLPPVDIDVGPDRSVHEDPEPIFACDDEGCTLVMSTVGFTAGEGVTRDVRLMRFHADTSVDDPVVVPGVTEALGFACAGDVCLIAEHRQGSNLLRGRRIDRSGAPLGEAFTIATLADGSRSVNVGADATGFVVTTGVGVTDAAPGRMHAIRVGLDGTVGADVDVMPTASQRSDVSLDWSRRDGIACGPSRCLLVATLDGISRTVARLDGTTVLDDPPLVIPMASSAMWLVGASAPGHALLSWQERRIVDGAPTTSVRAARVGATGWISPASQGLPGRLLATLAWTGDGYLAIATNGDVTRLGADGAVTGTAPAISGARALACQARCLIVGTSGYRMLVEHDGSAVDGSVAGPRGVPLAFETASTPGGFAVVTDTADVVILAATGDVISTIDLTEATTVDGVRPVVVDGTLIVAWRSEGTVFARSLGADLALSAPVELGIGLGSVAPLGHAALFTWNDYVAGIYYAARVDTSLGLLEAPFELAPGTVFDTGETPVAVSSGTAVSVAFTHLDPVTDARRLTVIPVRLQ